MKKPAMLITLITLVLVALPAAATIGFVETPHWVEDGLCAEITTTEGANVAVRGARWEPVVVVGWSQGGDASATDPECTGSQAVRTSAPGATETWRVFVPVPCPEQLYWSTRSRDFLIYEGFQLRASFDMGRPPSNATGTCLP